MALFSNYNKILYPLTDENGVEKIYNFVDILARIKISMDEDALLALTNEYVVVDGETPEAISLKTYGSQNYYWTILFINNLFDYIGNWFMSEEQLQKFVAAKYGEDNVDVDKYVTDNYGIVRRNPDPDLGAFQNAYTSVPFSGALQTLTNYHWESIDNETRRTIRVIKPNRILEFVRIFNATLDK